MKIIAVVDATFAKAKRIRILDLKVKLEQFSKTSKHKGSRTTGDKKTGSFCAAHSWIWYGGPVFSQHSGSNNSIVKSNGCKHKASYLVDIP